MFNNFILQKQIIYKCIIFFFFKPAIYIIIKVYNQNINKIMVQVREDAYYQKIMFVTKTF